MIAHLWIQVVGLASLAAVAMLLRRYFHRQAVLAYRLALIGLLSLLIWPAAQRLVQGRAFQPVWGVEEPVILTNSVEISSVVPDALRHGDPRIAASVERDGALARPSRDASPRLWIPILLSIWGLGVFAVLARQVTRVRAARRLFARSEEVHEVAIRAAFERVTEGSSLRGRVRLLASDEVASPACSAWPEPTIVIPTNPTVRTSSLECALRHELVHLERGDVWTAALMTGLSALWWFHPAVWWLARELDLLRELSCDEEAVRRFGERRRYAEALLVHAAAQECAAGPMVPLLAWFRSRSHLTRRIEMLVANRSPQSAGRRVFGAGLAIGLLALVLGAQLLAAAVVVPPPEEAPVDVRQEQEEPPSTAGPSGPERTRTRLDVATEELPRIGIRLEPVSEALAAHLVLKGREAYVITEVVEGSIAEKGGAKALDVLTALDNEPPSEAQRQVVREKLGAGEKVAMTVFRSGKKKVIWLRGPTSPESSPEVARLEMERELAANRAQLEGELALNQAKLNKELAANQAKMEKELAANQAKMEKELAESHAKLQRELALNRAKAARKAAEDARAESEKSWREVERGQPAERLAWDLFRRAHQGEERSAENDASRYHTDHLRAELEALRAEMDALKAALKAAESRGAGPSPAKTPRARESRGAGLSSREESKSGQHAVPFVPSVPLVPSVPPVPFVPMVPDTGPVGPSILSGKWAGQGSAPESKPGADAGTDSNSGAWLRLLTPPPTPPAVPSQDPIMPAEVPAPSEVPPPIAPPAPSAESIVPPIPPSAPLPNLGAHGRD